MYFGPFISSKINSSIVFPFSRLHYLLRRSSCYESKSGQPEVSKEFRVAKCSDCDSIFVFFVFLSVRRRRYLLTWMGTTVLATFSFISSQWRKQPQTQFQTALSQSTLFNLPIRRRNSAHAKSRQTYMALGKPEYD